MADSDEKPPAGSSSSRGIVRGILAPLHWLDTGISRFEIVVLAYGVLLMATNSVANVIGRFVFHQSLYFSEELNQFLIVLITFVGLGYATRQGRHIRMSAVYDQLPDIGKKILMTAIAAITATVMFVLAYYSYRYVERVWMLQKVTPALQLPLYLTYIWVPIGFAITGIQYALTVIKNLQSKDVYLSFEKVDQYEETEESLGP
ncbi:MAG: TRAP transporter small permease [Gammaproteobacteria bacterium]|nr:TRAP transporter small permease [Gammaproteobacteria bacterium]NIR82953.1 TRAP transporter small permease [Gammaproteobacteria bacterium]NIR90318.1 TRAP transporter small permease [Gammaproteobacteria bacterium]NIU04099.1 TRAP transporter small permease [Gammaproteobacteria bacterium]NIV51395.1 TRAP transporter small permease subunit [Gammaproteobacteria bacterium]